MSRLLSLRSVVGAPGSLSSVPDVHSAYTRACGLTSLWSGSTAVRGVAAAARAPAGWQEASSTGSASTSGRREFRSSAPRSVALGVVDQLHEEQAIALPSSSRRNFWEVCGRPRELLPAPATRVWSERCCLCTPASRSSSSGTMQSRPFWRHGRRQRRVAVPGAHPAAPPPASSQPRFTRPAAQPPASPQPYGASHTLHSTPLAASP